MTAMPMTHRKAGVRAFSPWFNGPTDSCNQPPPAQGCLSPRTTRVRGRVQSIDWHRAGRDCTYCAHDRKGQQRPDHGGSAHSTGGDNASGVVNNFHVASNLFLVGMGRGKGSQVRACRRRPGG